MRTTTEETEMFKNRSLQVKMIKDDASPDQVTTEIPDPAEMLASAGDIAEKVIKETTKIVATYVVLDTARKVIIAFATKK